MHLYYLLVSIGYKVSVNCRNYKENIFRLTATKNSQRKTPN